MIKKAVDVPVIVVGGIRSKDEINAVLSGEKADFVSMSRPFILEPDLVNKLRDGIEDEVKCKSCNYCLMGAEQRPLRCYYGNLPEKK